MNELLTEEQAARIIDLSVSIERKLSELIRVFKWGIPLVAAAIVANAFIGTNRYQEAGTMQTGNQTMTVAVPDKPSPHAGKEWLDRREAEELLDAEKDTVYEMIGRGELEAEKQANGYWRIRNPLYTGRLVARKRPQNGQ